MKDDLMHVIEGKAVSSYHFNCMFIHKDSVTGKVELCKLVGLPETAGDLVVVEYYIPKSITHTNWSAPKLVKCKDLYWYKKPTFTAEDLIK